MYSDDFDDIEFRHRMKRRFVRGKVAGGLLLVTAGLLFLGRELGADIPRWVFSWKMLLIAIGLAVGAKHAFSPGGWLIPIAIGSGFLLADLYPTLVLKPYLWPALLIIAGLIVLFKPYRHKEYYWRRWHARMEKKKMPDMKSSGYEADDYLEATAVFGGVKKTVFSKNFKGGDVTSVFGGAEVNLLNADFTGEARLELTQVIGGMRLIVPSGWQVKSAVTAVFGSVEDKREAVPQLDQATAKVLHLEGTSILGGIEITSV